MDILQEKWYGGLPCFKLATDMAQPRPLGVAAVTGIFMITYIIKYNPQKIKLIILLKQPYIKPYIHPLPPP